VSVESVFRTPEQVAKRTGLSRKAIYRAIERGELPAYRLCGRLRIHPDDEQTWLEHNRVTSTRPATPAPPGARPAPATHSLRRLLNTHENGPGLLEEHEQNATADSHK
jgi:excisionase family DNA binding protein